MNRMLVFAIFLLAMVMLFGGDTTSLLGVFIMLLVLGMALRIMFGRRRQKWGSQLAGNLALLVFVPMVLVGLLSPLISSILNDITGRQLSSHWLSLLLIVPIFAAYSWYSLHRLQNRQRGVDRFELGGSEREFIFSNTEYPQRSGQIERDNNEVWDQ